MPARHTMMIGAQTARHSGSRSMRAVMEAAWSEAAGMVFPLRRPSVAPVQACYNRPILSANSSMEQAVKPSLSHNEAVKVLVPVGALGIGVSAAELEAGIADGAEAIALDAGSTDSGP